MTRLLIVTNPQPVKVFYPKRNVYIEALKDIDPENAPGTDSSSSSLPIFSSLWRDYPGTEFRGATVSKLGKKIQIRASVFTFSVKLEKWSFDVTNSPRKEKKCTERKKSM